MVLTVQIRDADVIDELNLAAARLGCGTGMLARALLIVIASDDTLIDAILDGDAPARVCLASAAQTRLSNANGLTPLQQELLDVLATDCGIDGGDVVPKALHRRIGVSTTGIYSALRGLQKRELVVRVERAKTTKPVQPARWAVTLKGMRHRYP